MDNESLSSSELSMSRPYTYSILDENKQEIRLLAILPGTFGTDIRVSLETKAFAQDSGLIFEALSYTWGSPTNPIEILVEGSSETATLKVTQNLAEALPYLRYEDRPRIVWIDAICVNQHDLAERSSQVKRMADIYSSASRVVVWLGPESDDSALGISCCEKVSSHITVDWNLQTISPRSEKDLNWADKDQNPPFLESEIIALSNLFHRDWFSRLWIWQVHLAPNIMVLCGSRSTSWATIQDTVGSIYLKPRSQSFSNLMSRSHQGLLYDLCRGPREFVFEQLIEITKFSLCSDPRDRLYALFSLLKDEEKELAIVPNYSKTPAETFRDFTRHYIQCKKELQFLSTIEVHDEKPMDPSWVPDWSKLRVTKAFETLMASGLSAAPATFEGDGVLKVVGVTIGIIDKAEAFRLPTPDSPKSSMLDYASELQGITQATKLGPLLLSNAQKLGEFCRVLLGNNFSQLYVPASPNYPRVEDIKRFLKDLLSINLENFGEASKNVMETWKDSLERYCYNRSLVKCTNGAIGLAPKCAQPGDKLVVLLGCDTAMALRPCGSAIHQVLGDASYDGMDGSAFPGPLPENFRLVFLDEKTGKFDPEDPRLKKVQLPSGWRKSRYTYGGEELLFVRDGNDEETWCDPRLSVEALESQGVELESYTILMVLTQVNKELHKGAQN
ncbi:Heterokaryon incompatibility protein 6 OR allele [Lachnellula suecica]|uniref:Heterokaryon incompatibility protein 6 OR allele n=1 Tax=Lachnellula suecica TaxID=602035 RepID=A0A8T9CH42_9HELO|nr:Heterokaryon incompatibility protein 6 OR allele [Lachnellula suecica]